MYLYSNSEPITGRDSTGAFAFQIHYTITYLAAKQAGFSERESRRYAWQSVKIDWDTQGVEAKYTRVHGMSGQLESGSWQTREEAIASNTTYVAEMVESGMLGFAAHALQDPAVHDYAEWHRFQYKTVRDLLETGTHLLSDQAHLPAMIQAYGDTLRMFQEAHQKIKKENDEPSALEQATDTLSEQIREGLCRVGLIKCKKGIARFRQ